MFVDMPVEKHVNVKAVGLGYRALKCAHLQYLLDIEYVFQGRQACK